MVDWLKTTREDLSNGLMAAGTTVTKNKFSNTLVTSFRHLMDSKGLGAGKVLGSDETKIMLFGINSKCCV